MKKPDPRWKQLVAAMYYLAKKRPHQYRLDRKGRTLELLERFERFCPDEGLSHVFIPIERHTFYRSYDDL